MKSVDEQILRTAKEIVVKFIETGRVSPTGFADAFGSIYQTVHDTVMDKVPDGASTGEKDGV
jgi:hypothetical protein